MPVPEPLPDVQGFLRVMYPDYDPPQVVSHYGRIFDYHQRLFDHALFLALVTDPATGPRLRRPLTATRIGRVPLSPVNYGRFAIKATSAAVRESRLESGKYQPAVAEVTMRSPLELLLLLPAFWVLRPRNLAALIEVIEQVMTLRVRVESKRAHYLAQTARAEAERAHNEVEKLAADFALSRARNDLEDGPHPDSLELVVPGHEPNDDASSAEGGSAA